MPIRVLPEELAAKIAAGEVIERPASVVKELADNAIDAHAREIKVEARGGGQRLIRVMDDGEGISANQVAMAFERHATSKLSQLDDLWHLQTLGFRGEALPSIAAVARVTLITRAQGEETGTLIRVDGGKITSQQPHGAPYGTIVTVEDLFQHVPARLKFLKAQTTEAAQITELVGAYAMAYPHLRFSLLSEGRLAFQTAGSGRLMDVLIRLWGAETARQMIPVGGDIPAEPQGEAVETEVQVDGFVSSPSLHRSTRKYLYLFVNGRWIEDRALAHAVTEAYHTFLMVGRFPIAVLNLRLPTEAVDVNVHPTKSQVRFRDPGRVYLALQRSVRRALVGHASAPSAALGLRPSGPDNLAWPSPEGRPLAPDSRDPAASGESGRALGLVPPAPDRLPMLRVLGQVGSTYILAEGPDGMYVLDQHAAHERVLYDQLLAEREKKQIAAQALLEPAALELTPPQRATWQRECENLKNWGFELEEFGPSALLVRALPAVYKAIEPRRAVAEVLDELSEGGRPVEREAEARLVTVICKSAAVKAGQVLSLDEMRELVRRLEQTESPRTCPHGRPTAIRLDLQLLEREFGRR